MSSDKSNFERQIDQDIAYVLHHSRMPDSHGIDGGPVGMPQDLGFIRADGHLRAGHEFFNDF